MKTILMTNDDGYISKGLLDLAKTLKELDNVRVIIVAPANEKSACGHGLCVSKPLHLIEIEKDFYKLDDGTPTDCVYISMCELFKENKPDLVVSGINIGSNMGEDTIYSGTVAGAMEGAVYGIPSISVSQCLDDKYSEEDKTANRDFSLATSYIKNLAQDMLSGVITLGNGRKFFNVNVPNASKQDCKGIKITHLGVKNFNPTATRFTSPRGHNFHWIGFNSATFSHRDNTKNPYVSDSNIELISDFDAVLNGYISITPMQLDLTDYALLKHIHTDINKHFRI